MDHEIINECLPDSFYAGREPKDRLKMMVRHWQRAVIVNQTLQSAIDHIWDEIWDEAVKAERRRITEAIKDHCDFENKGDLNDFIIDLMRDKEE